MSSQRIEAAGAQGDQALMAIEFNPRTEPPMASRPSIEGDAREAFDLAKQATVGLVFKRDQINSDASLNADEKKRAITRNRQDRQSSFSRAKALLAREREALEALDAEVRHDPELVATPEQLDALMARRVAFEQASYGVGVAETWSDKQSGVATTDLRGRIAGLVKARDY